MAEKHIHDCTAPDERCACGFKPDRSRISPWPWTISDNDTFVDREGQQILHGWDDGSTAGDPHDMALIVAAPELLEECKAVIAWFESLKRDQHEKLVLGQTLESASRNWERMETPSFDFAPMMKAIAKAEGRT